MCVGICLALRLDGLDDDRAGLRAPLRRRLPGGPDLGGGDGRRPLRRRQPHRDRRLQPPPDRRHHRGGHGHRRRARQVRGLRLGLGRDRRPRHGRRSSRRWSAAARSTGRRRSSPRPRRAAASPSWRAASASTASRRARSRPSEALEELEATLEEQTKALSGGGLMMAEAKTEPIATRHGLRRRARRARRGARGRRRARRRPRRLDPVDQVRQAVPGPLLQLRRGRGEHDVDGLRARRHRQASPTPRPSRSSPPAAPTTRSGSGSPTTSCRCGSARRHGGVSLGEDGASHQMIEDIALMRAMPKMQVVVPADYNQAYRATIESYERDEPDVPALRPPGDAGRLRGDPRDARRRRRRRSARARTSRSVATGHMVWRALEAAESLEQRGRRRGRGR